MSTHTIIPLLILISLLSLLSSVHSLGINCRGSAMCDGVKILPDSNGSTNLIKQFRYAVGLNFTRVYLPYDHIACSRTHPAGGICLFTEGDSLPEQGTNASVIYKALEYLVDHGCTKCGSVPLSGDNDPNKVGWVTSNYVAWGVCHGICPPATPENRTDEGIFGSISISGKE